VIIIVKIKKKKKFCKNNNTLNKTEDTNIFHKENNINYYLNKYFLLKNIYDSNINVIIATNKALNMNDNNEILRITSLSNYFKWE